MMELRSFSWSATGEREQAGDDAEMEAAKLLDVRRLRSEPSRAYYREWNERRRELMD